MTPTLAYFAGLFDGEGSVTITLAGGAARKRQLHVLKCAVGLVTRAPLDALRRRFGGCVQGPVVRRNAPERQPMFVWDVSAVAACAFLRAVRPYLIVKRRQADVGIEFQTTKRRTRVLTQHEVMRRERLRQKIHRLNGYKAMHRKAFNPVFAVAA